MNLQRSPLTTPLRVLLVNPHLITCELLAEQILSGAVFGEDQPINLIFLVKEEEETKCEDLKWSLERCAFSCTSHIEVTSNFIRITDADVFCIMTNLKNPNCVDINTISKEEINAINYSFLLANNFIDSTIHIDDKTKDISYQDKVIDPIIMTDSLVTMNVLYNSGQNIPEKILFSPNYLEPIAMKILTEELKSEGDFINKILIWAVNDKAFHIEVMKPVITSNRLPVKDNVRNEPTQASESWMKKDFIKKIKMLAEQNHYGPIFKATMFSRALKTIWSSRKKNNFIYNNIGVISDGSYHTVKGAPYIMPVILNGHHWSVNKDHEQDEYLIQEIRQMNDVARANGMAVKKYCNQILKTVAEDVKIKTSTSTSASTITSR